jgi:hypothetical protein
MKYKTELNNYINKVVGIYKPSINTVCKGIMERIQKSDIYCKYVISFYEVFKQKEKALYKIKNVSIDDLVLIKYGNTATYKTLKKN